MGIGGTHGLVQTLPPPVCKIHADSLRRLYPWGSWGWSDGRWEMLRGYGCLWFPFLQRVLRRAMFHFLLWENWGTLGCLEG